MKGPSVLGNGSLNQVKIMKEELGFQKMFDREVMPLCLYSETPKQRRPSFCSEIVSNSLPVIQKNDKCAKKLGKRIFDGEDSDPSDYAMPAKR